MGACFRKQRVPAYLKDAVGTWQCIQEPGRQLRLSVFESGWIEMSETVFKSKRRDIRRGQAVHWQRKGTSTAEVTCRNMCWQFALNLQVSSRPSAALQVLELFVNGEGYQNTSSEPIPLKANTFGTVPR